MHSQYCGASSLLKKDFWRELEDVTTSFFLKEKRPLCPHLVSFLEREFPDPVCMCPAGASEPSQLQSHLLQLEKTDAEL